MKRRRFWTLYVAAWMPYALSYYVLFRRYGTGPLLQTTYNILPAMLVGVLAVSWGRLLRWDVHERWWFYPVQLLSAIAYSLLWSFGVLVFGSVGEALLTHHFSFGLFGGYALQWQFFSGLMIYCNIVGAGYVLQANARLASEQLRREQAEALQTSAQLSALRAQLNPHFLFNTLNSIAALAGPSQVRTLQAISQLAAMLRYTLGHPGGDEEVSLREELAFTDQYLALEELRLGARLRVIREIDEEVLRCMLPPLTLQPLVENAIRHGIAPRADGGLLTIRAWKDGSALRVLVQDDGLGAERFAIENASGLGLSVVRQRLALVSGESHSLQIETSRGAGFKVTFAMPQDASPGEWRIPSAFSQRRGERE